MFEPELYMNEFINIYTPGQYCVVDRRRPGDISPAPCDLRRDRYIAVFRVIVIVAVPCDPWPFGARFT